MAIALASMTAGGVVISQDDVPPAPTGLANIWIDANGGTCTDNATAVAYVDAAACGTWDAANDTCEGGDTVRVMAGSYGDAFLRGDNGRTGAICTFIVEDGQTVVADHFDVGRWQGSTDGASHVTIIGPIQVITLYAYTVTNVTLDNFHVDGEFTSLTPQIVNFVDSNITLKNSEIENSIGTANSGAMMHIEGDLGYTLDHNVMHDAYAGGGHTECTYLEQVDNIVITRNHYYRCSIFDIFITGAQGDNEADNYLIENNVFEAPCGGSCGATGGGNPAVKTRDGGFPDPSPNNWDVRFNLFVTNGIGGGLQVNTVGSNGLRLRGNTFVGTSGPCGATNVTSTYNAWTSGTCGSNSISHSESTYNSGWTGGSARWPGDFSLLTGSVLKNAGPTSDYPNLDLPGNTRFDGASADLGPYEFQE